MLKRFGIAADTEYAIAFRQGDNREFTQWTDSFTRNFLEYIQPAPNDPPKIDANLNVEHVKTGFRIWSEKTTTSPAGRVLPLYKLWLKKSEPAENVLSGDEFFQIITDILELSQKYIHPLERWQKVHNMFICKDPGVYKINRLRVVHIIDAELNLVRRELITRRLLSNAEMHGMIPKNNFGGRNGKTANDAVMLKYLT